MPSSARAEIMEAIKAGQDIPAATLLAIMLTVMDEIKDEISSIKDDVPGLREMVLNGHAGVHHDDHEFIGKLRDECEESKKRGEATTMQVITWGRQKILEEKSGKQTRRRLAEGWFGQMIWAVTTAVGIVLASGVVMWFSNVRLVVGG